MRPNERDSDDRATVQSFWFFCCAVKPKHLISPGQAANAPAHDFKTCGKGAGQECHAGVVAAPGELLQYLHAVIAA
jgi:hypothetical protein